MKFTRIGLIAVIILSLLSVGDAFARDAAFISPNMSVSGSSAIGANAISIEPKSEVDLGESVINISRRATFFFVNQTGAPVEIVNMEVNGDGNVTSSIVSDDCSKEGKIAPNSRCSVVVSVIPTNNGQWSAELMMTHNGAGRILKAKMGGKTSGNQAGGDRGKEAGLSLSSKDLPPINFGDVEIGESKAVRSALMINDSPDPITILSIDLIAADNGLERLDQGCSLDADLKPGESCPVTLVWKPANKGAISTDLIIRHSGKLGFVVIPVRGLAKEPMADDDSSGSSSGSKDKGKSSGKETKSKDRGGKNGKNEKISMPSTADELEKEVGKITSISSDELGVSSGKDNISGASSSKSSDGGGSSVNFRLIGTVGTRAVLLKPDGTTAVVGVGEELKYSGGVAKLIDVTPKTAEIFVDGERISLSLEAAEEIINKAAAAAPASRTGKKVNKKSSGEK